ncbi:MAG: CCA tRNA nucleotidyltransferase, partial [Lachnospiraceae bacterium]|nr:CCA tRNA nucleotidyltransferase [Lachnospiraceae bacterium]
MLIPANAELILRSLEEAGHEAYIVGGCVRDALLGREPQDWDITTSALPEQVQALFRRTIDTGIQHGTVTVMFGKEAYEVTTYRIDGEYHDGRHPDQVTFTRSLEEDLKRRDFTINAMAYNPKRGLVDLFGGQKDLAERVIRAVGDARERFSEDALRMLRAVRFAGQLGFAIEEGTLEGIRALAPTLAKISQERIREELTKLLLSPQPELLETAIDTGMTAVILPEADR